MKTHRDEINNMSNEELARFIAAGECSCCIEIETECNYNCVDGIVAWLNMEVENDKYIEQNKNKKI